MKMQFGKDGRRFFFLPFCLRGREPLLSRVVNNDRELRPRTPATGGSGGGATRALSATVSLLPAGGAVAALWRSVHVDEPCLTASNYVVMPDHVHLLLIVDYAQNPAFDVLDWLHHFMRASEDVIAPIIGRKPSLVWEDRFWLLLVNAGISLAAVRRYIKMNPARRLWKNAHPDMFVRHSGLRHRSLDPTLSWSAIGNLTLLASPFLLPVVLTRKMTVEQHEPEIERIIAAAKCGMIPVCGFLSPGEKRVQELLRNTDGARWIKTVPYYLPPRFDPSVEDSRILAEERMLVLSSFPPGVPESPINWDNCHAMNDRNHALAARAAQGRAPTEGGRGVAPGRCPPPNLSEKHHEQ